MTDTTRTTDDEDEIGGAAALLMTALGDDATARLVADGERAVLAFGAAMLTAQQFEMAARMANAALLAPADDDVEAKRIVGDALAEKNLNASINNIAPAAVSRITLPPDLITRLHEARARRNRLAHGYVIPVTIAITSGNVDGLVTELEADSGLFDSVTCELFATAFRYGLGQHGLDLNTFDNAAAAMLFAAITNPELMEGVEHLTDFDVVIERLEARLAAASDEAMPEAPNRPDRHPTISRSDDD